MSRILSANWLRQIAKISSLFAAACALPASALDLVSPEPGDPIDNIAQAFFINIDDPSQVVQISSNLARVITGSDYGLSLDEDQSVNASSGQPVFLPHRLTNLGNTSDAYDLLAENLIGDDGDLTIIAIYQDLNGNGVSEAGEPTITQTPSLDSGEILDLVILATVPSGTAGGTQYSVSITATSVTSPVETQTNTDSVTIIDGAFLRISKTSSQVCSIPVGGGDLLTYTADWTNTGDQSPVERLHTVDGAQLSGVLIEDRLPADVDVVAGQALTFVPNAAQPVVMTSEGLLADEWISYSSWDGVTQLARIGLLTPASQLMPSQSGTFEFDVRVSENVTLNTQLENQIVVDENGDGSFEFASSVVCNTTTGPEAKIRFLSPTFENIINGDVPEFEQAEDFSDTLRYRFDADAADYNPTFDGVYVELNSTSIPEENLQFLEDGRRQVVVNVTSQNSGQTVPTLVRETELGSGIYRNTTPLILSLDEGSDGSLCGMLDSGDVDYSETPPDSCVLRSGQDDSLTVSFFDRGLGEVIDDASIVDPLGYVFNALTLEPIEGVEVRVYNAINNGPGGLQDELANDPFAPPGTPLVIQFTNEVGFYQYPFMFAGSYYMEVVLPPESGYAWPSTRTPLLYPSLDVTDFSYGRNGYEGAVIDSGVFVLDADNPIVAIDFPVDPVELELVVDGSVSCDADVNTDDPIAYSTTFANSGNIAPPEREIFIDGLSRTGVVVEALVPLNTVLDPDVVPTFSPASAELILNLYDGADSDTWVDYDTWIAQAPEDRLFVQSIGLLVPSADLEPSGTPGVIGEGGDLSYGVRIAGQITAGTQIINQVTVDLDGDGAPDISGDEDFQDACESASGPEAQVRFLQPADSTLPDFTDGSSFIDQEIYGLNGTTPGYEYGLDGVYVQLDSTSIRAEDLTVLEDGRRRLEVEVSSALRGDAVTLVLEETAYASGQYRSIRPLLLDLTESSTGLSCPQSAVIGADYSVDVIPSCVLQSAQNDELVVSFLNRFESSSGLGDAGLTDTALVDPFGVVFISSDPYEVVSGAIVRIYRVTGGAPEVVGDPIVTRADGSFSFPSLEPGDYYIEIENTDEFSFASDASIAELIDSGYNLLPSSYGFNGGLGVFSIDDETPLRVFDVPVDLTGISAELVVQKNVNLPEVEIGGLLEYSVSVSNIGDRDATAVEVVDRLPFGFKYIENTLRQDDVQIVDPEGAPGPEITFDLGTLPAGESVEYQYVLQATAGALDSDGVNIAQASGFSGLVPVASNAARVQVEIGVSGVLSTKGIIFGKIFVDADCNNIQSQGEWPVGGVALYLEDGTYAITDENGQYSIYGINPGVHSIKLDPLTLPEGLKLKPLDNRNLADPDSRVVDLLNGEFHRADFAAACPSPEEAEEVYAQVAARNQSIQGDWLSENSASFNPLERSVSQFNQYEEGDFSSGSLLSSSQRESAALNQSFAGPIYGGTDFTATSEEEVNQAVLVEEEIYRVTEEEGKEGLWLWPSDDISLFGRFVVAVRDGLEANLFVNGEQISRGQIGEEAHNPETNVQVLAWYGVRLSSGENLVEVKATDVFGIERILLSKEFVSPGAAVELAIEPENDVIAADGGRTSLPVRISVLDQDGNQANGIHYVTVELTDGRLLEEDVQAEAPGIQIRLDRGTKVVNLVSSLRTGDIEIRAHNDQFEASTIVRAVAAQRSLLVSGIASASATNCSIDSDGYAPTAEACENGMFSERTALFMKGSVRGNLFLTLSYDTDKVADGELLRDINPDEYYPIFGDSSVRGFEAQSRSKLYAKLELDKSFMQWGDFATDRSTDFQDLGRVQRTMTGFSAQLDQGDLNAEVFTAEVEDIHESVEISGNGTAMLFSIPNAPIVRNSETVELIVRDRDTTGLVLSSTNLVRFVDYTLDHLTGDLRFTRTIPTVDSDLNPVSIRVSYNREGGGESHRVSGARVNYDLSDSLIVGGSYTEDGSEENGFELSSGFVQFKPSQRSEVFVSTASMDHVDDTQESGNALYAQVEMSWQNGGNSILRWGRADAGFTNSSSGVASDREELQIQHNQPLTQTLSFDAELVNSEVLSSAVQRQSAKLGVDYSIGQWTLSLGGRRIEQQSADETQDNANTIIAGAGRGFSVLGKSGNIDVELEREIGEQDRKRWTVQTSLQAHEHLSLYGNVEQVNSLTGPASLRTDEEQITSTFGIETDFLPSTSVFNEYRLRGVTDGRDLEAITGVRGDYAIVEGLSISPSIESVDILDGDSGEDSWALSLGIEDVRNANSRTQARIESRFTEDRDYYGLDLSYVARVNLDWSIFAREELSYSILEESENDLSHELTLGLTHRPRENNRYHALFMYQWAEREGAGLLDNTSLHLLSTHQNYQWNEDIRLSGRLGAKYESVPLLDEDFSSLTAVMDGRVIWDITRRLDFDLHAGVLGTNSFDETRYSFGAGLSFLVMEGLRVGVGYNFTGFDEGDLDSEGYNRQGIYIHAEYKFDEDLFHWLESDLYRRENEE